MAWTVSGSLAGPQGIKGDKGDTGTAGSQGIQGPIGPSGSQGIQGPQGVPGNDGAPGQPGDPGSPGEQGTPGTDGTNGMRYRGAWSDDPDTNATVTGLGPYVEGDSATYNGSVYILDTPGIDPTVPPVDGSGNLNTGWHLFAAEGAQGSQGVKGDKGDTGSAGSSGAQGIQGSQGIQGIAGERGSQWYTGTGAPGDIPGSAPGDNYLDLATGLVYTLS